MSEKGVTQVTKLLDTLRKASESLLTLGAKANGTPEGTQDIVLSRMVTASLTQLRDKIKSVLEPAGEKPPTKPEWRPMAVAKTPIIKPLKKQKHK